jgi:glycosyltransferase involved in cell wall biosynthesis
VRLPPHAADVRTTYQGAVPGVEQLYGLGDVFLLPQKFRATSLPIQEAMAAGMPVLTTDMPPFNEFCQFLIPSRGVSSLRGQFMKRDVLSHQVEPQAIANAIDHLAGQDISEASRAARRYAESIGWQVLAPRWLAACNGSLPGIRQRD